MLTKSEELALEILSICKTTDRDEILFRLRTNWWGKQRTNLQDDILFRYDNPEHWDKDIITTPEEE